MRSRQMSFALLLSAVSVPAWAASHPCATVVDPAARLACYDKAFPPAPEVKEAAARRGIDDFGIQRTQAPLVTAGQTQDQADPDRIEATVAKVVHAGAGRTVTLANGQVWMVTEATSRGPIREGDVVAVRKGVMGNYVLVTADGVGLRVRRVR
jgi:hypothetical protein